MSNLYAPFPPELDHPSTAWPFLKKRFPWLFDDEKAIKPVESVNRVEKDVLDFAVFMLGNVQYSLADISEALTGKREYGGAIYTRIKAVRDYLENTTTTDIEAVEVEDTLLMAA